MGASYPRPPGGNRSGCGGLGRGRGRRPAAAARLRGRGLLLGVLPPLIGRRVLLLLGLLLRRVRALCGARPLLAAEQSRVPVALADRVAGDQLGARDGERRYGEGQERGHRDRADRELALGHARPSRLAAGAGAVDAHGRLRALGAAAWLGGCARWRLVRGSLAAAPRGGGRGRGGLARPPPAPRRA